MKTSTGETFALVVELADAIEDAKVMIQDQEGFLSNKEQLSFKDQSLEDKRTLSDYNVQPNSTLHLAVRKWPIFHTTANLQASVHMSIFVKKSKCVVGHVQ